MRNLRIERQTWSSIAMLMVILAASTARANGECEFFVRAGFVPEGEADGRTPETAFASIADGVAAVLNPGDVVCVGPGLYVEGDIVIGRDGAPGVPMVMDFPIEIRGDVTGETTGDSPGPVRLVPPSGLPADETPGTAFLVLGRHDVVIEGFEISGYRDAGIQVRSGVTVNADNSASVSIRNNSVRNCRTGIDVNAEGVVVVEGNTVIANAESGISVQDCSATSDFGVCRGLVGEPVMPIVSNNRSGGNGAHGIFVRGADGAVIQNNIVYSNRFTGVTLRGSSAPLVANNLVYANGEEGLALGSGFFAPGDTQDPVGLGAPGAVVLGNTFYANAEWGVEIGNPLSPSPGGTVANNIVWRNGQGRNGIGILNERQFDLATGAFIRRATSTCGYVAGFNLVLDEYGPDTPRNTYDLRADPLFVDPEGPDGVLGGEFVDGVFLDGSGDDDFRLQQDGLRSPAVDAGSAAASEIGLIGSTAPDGRLDSGVIDLGFHYDAAATQVLRFTPPFMPLYVRTGGEDINDGLTPARAFASIRTAARRARAGVSVVVGPGTYNECDIHPPPYSGKAAFVGDSSGAMTGDAPGVVLIDAGKCFFNDVLQEFVPGETGFNIPNVCGVVVDGFHITRARDDGVQIQTFSDGAVVRNVAAFANGKRGINVVNAEDVRIVNNLLFANNGGIQVGGACNLLALCLDDPPLAGSRRAVIEHNTAYANTFNGIQVGTGEGVSSFATVRYNVTGQNGQAGFEVGNDETRALHLEGYAAAYNATASPGLTNDGYGTGVPRGAGDLRLDLRYEPLYVDPTAIRVSGDWLQDESFRLMQAASGQDVQCRAVNYGDITADEAGLDQMTTRTDGAPDEGIIDLGYHYPRGRGRAGVGDCNGDGRVIINELITMVNIALGNSDLSVCAAGDANSDGAITVDDLIRGVNTVLRSS
jgi:parallel beta-helix repeat protein